MTETDLLRAIQLAASPLSMRLFRNNCGSLQDATGRWVKYGVANPGGSDLIGWTTVTITPEMVGQQIAVFSAIEVKTLKGKASSQQLQFIRAVQDSGGIAGVARSIQNLNEIINARR